MKLLSHQSRRYFSLGLLSLLGGSIAVAWEKRNVAAAQREDNREEVTVGTVEEFFSAIAPNRTIKLKPITYLLSSLNPNTRSQYARLEKVFDGYELIISDVENLKIIGVGNSPSRLLAQPRYAEVLRFRNCHNLTIENIEAGHSPEPGYCHGGVLYFADSDKISINRCLLFGSGTIGIIANRIQRLSCQNTEITNCTYHGLTIESSNEVEFTNCKWTKNREFELINIGNSSNVQFIKCEFIHNFSSNLGSVNNYLFFNLQSSQFYGLKEDKLILVKDCIITDNYFAKFTNNFDRIKLVNTRIENNSFRLER